MIFNVKFLSFAGFVLVLQFLACSSTVMLPCISSKACKRATPCASPICARSSVGHFQTPLSSPVKSPVQAPVQAPVETFVQSPVQIPIQAPVKAQTPVQSPVQTPVVSGCWLKSFCGKKRAPAPKTITKTIDDESLMLKIDEVNSKALKYAAVSSAVLSAPTVAMASKVSFMAGKLPGLMAAKGAILGSMIATPIQKAAVLKSSLTAKAIGKVVSGPFAAYAVIKSLMMAKKFKSELNKKQQLVDEPVKGLQLEQPLQAPVKSLEQEPVQSPVKDVPIQAPVKDVPVQAPVKDVPVQEPVKDIPVKSPEVKSPAQEAVKDVQTSV